MSLKMCNNRDHKRIEQLVWADLRPIRPTIQCSTGGDPPLALQCIASTANNRPILQNTIDWMAGPLREHWVSHCENIHQFITVGRAVKIGIFTACHYLLLSQWTGGGDGCDGCAPKQMTQSDIAFVLELLLPFNPCHKWLSVKHSKHKSNYFAESDRQMSTLF